jgi:hypothetical protein
MSLPNFPLPPAGGSWNPHVLHAYEILRDISVHTRRTLQSAGNLHRIRFYADLIASDAVPLLLALEAEGEQLQNRGLELINWTRGTAHHFGQLSMNLLEAEQREQARYANYRL